MIEVKLASQFSKFTCDVNSFQCSAQDTERLLLQMEEDFAELHAEIVHDGRLSTFISLVVNNVPYTDAKEIAELRFENGDKVYLLSAIAGG